MNAPAQPISRAAAFSAAHDAADRNNAATIAALFAGGYPQAVVHHSGGGLFLIEIDLTDDPEAEFPHIAISDLNGHLPANRDHQHGWCVGLYLGEDIEERYFQSEDASYDTLIRLVNEAAAAARA